MEADPLAELVRRHAGLIHKVARAYFRDAADREDVVQEIALQLWRAQPRFDPRQRESTWVYRIALNVAISFQRRARRHGARREPLVAEELAGRAPSEASVEVERLLACIEELAPLERALVLLYLEGEEHAAIAEVLGLSPTNVGTKLMRTKERLRVALERRARQEQEPDSHATRHATR
jgi:RNA polymerase sigma-70 factor (ECF subfamily)